MIRGMEMPKGRPVCIVIDAAGQARRYDLNNDRYADNELFEAVPVPPHGRLGDLDELYASLKKWLIQNRHSMTEATRVWIRGVLKGIAAAPTIIPAEEDE